MANQTPQAVVAPRRKALASVRRGVMQTPIRALIYGPEKVGKSSFAAGAPRPIFIGVESGTVNLDVDRMQPSTWEEAMGWIDDLAADGHEYKTLVLDPANWLEPMAWASLTGPGGGSIEDYGGGYGKGHTAAVQMWRQLLFGLERCWTRGMNIVITAHSQVKTFQNPEGAAYDRYELAMNAKAAGVLKQWVDAVLFAQLETFVNIDKRTKRALGTSSGARVLHTHPCAAYDAGTRWKLPEELPLSWDDFYGAIQAETGRASELLTQVESLFVQLDDAKVRAASKDWLERNKTNADRLVEFVNRLNLKIEEKKATVAA